MKEDMNYFNDERMRELGFTDHREGYWYFCCRVADMITWNVAICKRSGGVQRDVMDEYIGQPYPFLRLADEGVEAAQKIADEVELMKIEEGDTYRRDVNEAEFAEVVS